MSNLEEIGLSVASSFLCQYSGDANNCWAMDVLGCCPFIGRSCADLSPELWEPVLIKQRKEREKQEQEVTIPCTKESPNG